MSRTISVIERDIAEVKARNVDWMTNSQTKALITALTMEKNLLGEFNNDKFMTFFKYIFGCTSRMMEMFIRFALLFLFHLLLLITYLLC